MQAAVEGQRGDWAQGRLARVAVGAFLFAVLNLIDNSVAIDQLPPLRLAIVIPIAFGAAFGPLVGLLVGAVGMLFSDAVTYGVFLNWEAGAGIVGAVSGLTPSIAARLKRTWAQAVVGPVIAPLAIASGLAFATLTDIWIANLAWDEALTAEFAPALVLDWWWGLPLAAFVLPAVRAWQLRRRP